MIDLANLDGSNGFRVLPGDDGLPLFGLAVAGSDLNGDGLTDVAITDPFFSATPTGTQGAVYVVYGSDAGFSVQIDVPEIAVGEGYALIGSNFGEVLGISVAGGGDFDGDGLDDLLIGEPQSPGITRVAVSLGAAALGLAEFRTAELGGALPGGLINSPDSAGRLGSTVASLGDIDDDGLADAFFGAIGADQLGFIVYGTGDFEAADLSQTGAEATRLTSDRATGLSLAVGAGDVNGDTIADVLVGLPRSVESITPGTELPVQAGSAFVILGGGPRDAALDTTGAAVELIGAGAGARLGAALAGLGDVNGDGIDDFAVAAPGDPLSAAPQGPAAVYVVFGRTGGLPALVDVSALDGTDGFAIFGGGAQTGFGTVQAGGVDVDGDGLDDVMVGAPNADPDGRENAGSVFVVYGSRQAFPAALNANALAPAQGFRIDGVAAGDGLGQSLAGLPDVDGDGIGDIAIGASSPATGGAAYVVFGEERAAGPGEIFVDTFLDVVDPNDGLTSLREAVSLANAAEGVGTIRLEAGDYQLTLQEDVVATPFAVTGFVRLVGAGRGQTTILSERDQRTVFDVAEGASFEGEGFTLRGGRNLPPAPGAPSNPPPPPAADTGAVASSGMTRLVGVTIESFDNTGRTATAVPTAFPQKSTDFVVEHSRGAAIHGRSGVVDLEDVLIRDNAGNDGVGILADPGAAVQVASSRVEDNVTATAEDREFNFKAGGGKNAIEVTAEKFEFSNGAVIFSRGGVLEIGDTTFDGNVPSEFDLADGVRSIDAFAEGGAVVFADGPGEIVDLGGNVFIDTAENLDEIRDEPAFAATARSAAFSLAADPGKIGDLRVDAGVDLQALVNAGELTPDALQATPERLTFPTRGGFVIVVEGREIALDPAAFTLTAEAFLADPSILLDLILGGVATAIILQDASGAEIARLDGFELPLADLAAPLLADPDLSDLFAAFGATVTVVGDETGDRFDGFPPDARLEGRAADDVYVVAPGDEHVVIADAGGADTLVVEGVSAGALLFEARPGAPDDLFASLSDGTEIRIEAAFAEGAIETLIVDGAAQPLPIPAPTAAPDAFAIDEDATLIVAGPGVLGNDGVAGGEVTLLETTTRGTLALRADGGFEYRPDLDAFGQDGFTYRLANASGAVETVVTIDVAPVADAPVADDDGPFAAPAGEVFTTPSVLVNDVDVDGDRLVVSAFDAQTRLGAAVTSNGDGTFDIDYRGIVPPAARAEDSFGYEVSDPSGLSDAAQVSLEVSTPTSSAARVYAFKTLQVAVDGKPINAPAAPSENLIDPDWAVSTRGRAFRQFVLLEDADGASGDGPGVFDGFDAAYNLSDVAGWNRLRSLPTDNGDGDPVLLSASAPRSFAPWRLANRLTFDDETGFGLRGLFDGRRGGSTFETGEALDIRAADGGLGAIELTVASGTRRLFRDDQVTVAIDVDGDVAKRWRDDALLSLDGLSRGDRLRIDFAADEIRLNDVVLVDPEIDAFFAAAGDAPENLTIGAERFDFAGFSMRDVVLEISDEALLI